MIQLLTHVDIIDNSGGKTGQCIKILKPAGRKYAILGDEILVTIKKESNTGKVKKGTVHRALIVQTKKGLVKGGKNYGQ